MRALVLKPDPTEHAALVAELLAERGIELHDFVVCEAHTDPVSHLPYPDPTAYDLVVSMGSPWSVYDRTNLGSWIDRHLAAHRQAHEAGVPVLGICFGGQSLAAALGGRVERSPAGELGWCTVHTDRPDAIAPGPWMQWHTDRFVVPPGAEELARSDICSQAFVIGRSVGLQFHPEVRLAEVAEWIALGHGELAGAGFDPDELLDRSRVEVERSRPNTTRLVEWFLDEVAV